MRYISQEEVFRMVAVIETIIYPGFDGTNTTGPIQVSRTYFPAANSGYLYYTETLTTSATPHLTSGLPDGTESITGSNIQSLERDFYNAGGQMIWSDRYFSFSGLSYSQTVSLSGGVPADLGTLGTHYYRTTLGYDEAGRQNEVIAPTGTININVFNSQSQITSQWIGTTDTHTGDDWTPATNTGNMMDVQDNVYDSTHDFISPPGAPSLSSTSGGSLAGSIFYVVITYLGSAGETLGSSQSNLTISANHLLTVASPSSATGATSYNVYVGILSNGESLQTSTPITIGTNWTEPTTGMVSTGVAVPEDIGDGNLTKVTMHPGLSQPDRVTQNLFDWRDRLVLQKNGVQSSEDSTTHRPITYLTYDNLGEVTEMDLYDGDGVSLSGWSFTSGVPNAPSSSLLRAKSTSSFDDQGRVYESKIYSVDQSTGTVGSALTTDNFFDHRGDKIAVYAPGGLATKDVYDGAGRVSTQYTTDGGSVHNSNVQRMGWSDAGSVSNDVVFSQTEIGYDADSNAILTTTRDRFDNDATSSTGGLGSPSAGIGARDSYIAGYFDAADRPTDQVNVGTNGGSTYTRPSSVPSRSDTVLVTHTDYDPAGNAWKLTDPRNILTQYNFDMLGRVAGELDNSTGGSPATGSAITGYTYDGDNNVLTMLAYFPGTSTPTQTTAYVRGIGGTSGTNLFSNDVIAKVEYPIKTGGSAGSPDTSSSGSVSYAYNLLADVLTNTDQNGNVHTLSYDILGRLKLDAVTTLGSGVDGAVRALGYNFTALGLPYQQTSYSNSSAATVVNQVQDVYNGYGQLLTQYQEHSGSVSTGSSLNVQYAYSQPSGANYSRLSSETYPNGRQLDFVYNSGVDSDISRVSGISDDAGTGAGSVESYKYVGLATIVQRTDGNGIALTYIKQSGESNGDAGDQYIGLDRFGRIADQRFIPSGSPSSPTDRFQYGFDRDGNVLFKNNLVSSSFSELYHANSSTSGDNATAYDKLNRLTGFRRGTLSASSNNSGGLDTVSTLNTLANSQQSFTLDAVGNQASVTTDGTATSRTVNSGNQISALGSSSLAYDNNGNTTTDSNGLTLVYDAWNRQVAAKSGGTTLVSYTYDAASNRITRTASSTTTDYYLSSVGQVIEERQSSTVTSQYVWGLGYVNDLILRDDNSTSGSYGKSSSGLGRRVYVQQDSNFNVTTITDTSGTVLERFINTPYAVVTVLSATWSATTDSYAWVFRFQGSRFDSVTNQDRMGVRDLGVDSFTWEEADPTAASYINGADLYQVEVNNPIDLVDPTGLAAEPKSIGELYKMYKMLQSKGYLDEADKLMRQILEDSGGFNPDWPTPPGDTTPTEPPTEPAPGSGPEPYDLKPPGSGGPAEGAPNLKPSAGGAAGGEAAEASALDSALGELIGPALGAVGIVLTTPTMLGSADDTFGWGYMDKRLEELKKDLATHTCCPAENRAKIAKQLRRDLTDAVSPQWVFVPNSGPGEIAKLLLEGIFYKRGGTWEKKLLPDRLATRAALDKAGEALKNCGK
jgi:YD repeat-containing protein